MKKLIIWLAKIFKVNLVKNRIIIKEVTKEVPKEIIKEVIKEVPSVKEINLTYKSGDLTVKGNLVVEGDLDVEGEVTCFKINKK